MSSEINGIRAEIGPFRFKSSDWDMLQRTIDAFCKTKNGQQVFFAVSGNEENGVVNADGLIVLPVKTLLLQVGEDLCVVNPEIISMLSKVKQLVAFGYVRTEESTARKEHDYWLSVMIDMKFKRSIYYIIMNSNFEYNVYKNPVEILSGLMQPVDDDVRE